MEGLADPISFERGEERLICVLTVVHTHVHVQIVEVVHGWRAAITGYARLIHRRGGVARQLVHARRSRVLV